MSCAISLLRCLYEKEEGILLIQVYDLRHLARRSKKAPHKKQPQNEARTIQKTPLEKCGSLTEHVCQFYSFSKKSHIFLKKKYKHICILSSIWMIEYNVSFMQKNMSRCMSILQYPGLGLIQYNLFNLLTQ